MDIKLLKRICEAPGAPGREQEVRKIVEDAVSSYADEFYTDNLGNLVVVKRGTGDRKVMVAAHLDEISFIVTHVDEDGFARFHTLGGFDPKTLTAQRVIVHGKEPVMGVMGSKPIHLMKAEDRTKAPKTTDFFIDFGMSAEKVKQLVSVGDVVTRERTLIEMGDCVNGKSLDNRVSVFILAETLRQIGPPAHDLYAVFTVQEEVGIRGAQVATHSINPDFGIGLDTTIAFDLPGASSHEKITELGKGAAIKIMDSSVISDSRMIAFLRDTANDHGIPWQNEILTAGGTDTSALQRAGKMGSIAGCISVPTRHIHSVIEMCHKQDIQAAISLLTKSIENLDKFDYNWK